MKKMRMSAHVAVALLLLFDLAAAHDDDSNAVDGGDEEDDLRVPPMEGHKSGGLPIISDFAFSLIILARTPLLSECSVNKITFSFKKKKLGVRLHRLLLRVLHVLLEV